MNKYRVNLRETTPNGTRNVYIVSLFINIFENFFGESSRNNLNLLVKKKIWKNLIFFKKLEKIVKFTTINL